MSLKGRGIKLLLRYDKDRAKQIVFSIGGRLDLKPRRCEDQLVFDVAEIYAAVGDVAKASFNEKETSEGVRALFVTPWIENLDSPVQIQPAFNLLMRLQGPPIERELLYHALARGINRNFGDDRSFAFAANVGLVSKEGSLTSDESRWAADLRLAYRDYLLKNLRGSRCKDHQLNEGENLPAFIGVANRLFPDRPITFEDLTAFEYKGEVMANDLVAMSDSLRELRQELLALKKEAQPTATADGKSDEAWPIKVNAFVERIRSWEPKEKFSQFDRFRVGITMLLSVLESIQDGDLKVAVVRRTLQTLNDSAIQRSNFVEWLYHVNRVRTAYPNEFAEIAPQIPNQSFSVILASKRLGV
ncbi:MAG TPA: hypothetical protein PLK77_10690 [Pyrinomonadaceae bacterium]|nr:hypothetical protein [Pyrinomonadaceae bacterium]